jgi:hypothetical protein
VPVTDGRVTPPPEPMAEPPPPPPPHATRTSTDAIRNARDAFATTSASSAP